MKAVVSILWFRKPETDIIEHETVSDVAAEPNVICNGFRIQAAQKWVPSSSPVPSSSSSDSGLPRLLLVNSPFLFLKLYKLGFCQLKR